PAGLVALLLLHPHRLSPKGRHRRPDRGGAEGRQARRGARARSLSPRCETDAQRLRYRLCLDLRARRLQDRRLPRAAAPDHAPRSQEDRTPALGRVLMNAPMGDPPSQEKRIHLLTLRLTGLDPDVWSGRALQESLSSWWWTVLPQCIPALT